MRPKQLSPITSVTTSRAVILNWRERPFNASVTGIVSGTLTWKIQVTTDDVDISGWSAASANWVDYPSSVNLTTTVTQKIDQPVTAVRFSVTSFTSGSLTPQIVQGGAGGS